MFRGMVFCYSPSTNGQQSMVAHDLYKRHAAAMIPMT